MKTLLLTHFDSTFGPKIFLKAPETVNADDFQHIPPLMDLYREGFFYHEFNKDKSANLNIQVPSRYARGNFELLMISYLVRDGQLNPDTAKEYLINFAEKLKQIDGAYKAFYVDSSKHAGDAQKFEEIKELFNAFYESIPAEINMFQPKQAKIFVFGITKAGKTTILQAVQNQNFKENKPNTFIDVSKILIPNTDVSIMVYDAPGQIKYRTMWIPNLAGQNGLVFVVDVADKDRFSEAKIVLHEIATRPETKQLPLLMLFNKIDLKKPKVDQLVKELQLDTLGKRSMKYFETSAITGEGILEAFSWLAKTMTDSRSG
ncbi:MAG TPA: ADP-ribosylation factor-like protein [Candidatus Lokiarchaeia archaeon]|nr:ADP-ribosylation factor-like protein [Candidatus Lokiarchaeia archaeon]